MEYSAQVTVRALRSVAQICLWFWSFGRTEVIDNTLNPDFVRKYIMDYFFEEKQNLRFDLYDVDSKSPDLSKHDFLGQMFCTLGEIVGSPASRLEKPLG
uniref:C2 domain-containing protein n=1 Tax=Knipowitschia caucasica TaxID=637954 RepID=A0AAV2M527_KNICA